MFSGVIVGITNENLYFLDGSLYISKIDKLIFNDGFISKKTKKKFK